MHLAARASLGSAEAGTATQMRARACARRYVIEDDQILFSSQHGLHANEIRQFALQAARRAAAPRRRPSPSPLPSPLALVSSPGKQRPV